MKHHSFFCIAAVLAAVSLPCAAVPDANGQVTSTPAPDLSADSAMKARLNYNLGYEVYEKAMAQETAAARLKGAAAREAAEAVKEGFSEARERFRTVVAADPNMKEAWNLIGYTSRRLGEYEESLSAYDAALKLEPDYPEAIEYRAELFLLTGRLAQAREAYATLQRSNPSYAGVLLQSMRSWVASPPASAVVEPAEKEAFVRWVAAQKS
ncbi:MAG TPA: tetratricopeptide repeat protein [Steroidobacteraceae bacterium]|nr:tetratricopeptide repeat protein [Steroidobacteraceae bacterium]